MNTRIYTTAFFVIIALSISLAQEHVDSKTWRMDIKPYKRIHIYNTGGAINVTGTSGNEIVIEVTRTLKAKNNEKLEEAKKQIYVDTMNLEDNLYFFVENPYRILEIHEVGGKAWYNSRQNGKWRWSQHEERKELFEFTMEVRIPHDVALTVDTHKKDVTVKGVQSRLRVGNHYGNVYLEDIGNIEYAESHHGSIYANFRKNPTADGSYKTHHGEIKLAFPAAPSADVSLDSYHGSFFTDFDWQPQPLVTLKESNKNGTHYKVGGDTNVRIGSGAHKISMSTHHGNLYLLKKS